MFYLCSLALPERHWWDGLVGAAVGYGVPWLIGEIYYRVRKIEGMGLGDSTMLALVGALFGWKGVIATLFGGSVIGTFVSVPMLLVARGRARSEDGDRNLMTTEVPFGPFLAAAAVFYLFAEPWLTTNFRL